MHIPCKFLTLAIIASLALMASTQPVTDGVTNNYGISNKIRNPRLGGTVIPQQLKRRQVIDIDLTAGKFMMVHAVNAPATACSQPAAAQPSNAQPAPQQPADQQQPAVQPPATPTVVAPAATSQNAGPATEPQASEQPATTVILSASPSSILPTAASDSYPSPIPTAAPTHTFIRPKFSATYSYDPHFTYTYSLKDTDPLDDGRKFMKKQKKKGKKQSSSRAAAQARASASGAAASRARPAQTATALRPAKPTHTASA
ncbi:hypothetical protein BDF20DRAFT_839403 [Mycotypha africana]|uniref:uncharacterized protein n=1 Tax=Mycotypha africana TaxID=64632 RepID=UPI002300A448|nr:uncharacterized protein BDF20DRAFT_839403 [Mycotypha africana]KAI8968281.1 hypothetical protein BDF20DRAFT_839403 [Mycotypha africana]